MVRNKRLGRKLTGNTFKGQQEFLIGLLFLVFSLSQSIFAMAEDVLPKALLPDLENYGFELTKVIEMTQSDWMGLSANLGKQFGISGSDPSVLEQLKEQLNFPLFSATGSYSKTNKERIAIHVYKFENERNSRKWFDSEVTKKKELETLLKTTATTAKLERTQVNGKEAYCFTYGSSNSKAQTNPGYETSLFWQKGVYFFDAKFYSQAPWPQTEAGKIANEIMF